ncbi:MAG: mechanosensitive ion channel [OCS116 cluster bacterium]|uniref:Mechanosensitive ion channel protein MscS n=1 Tax=OCS116 cluster bacterium TaxID=2030921 RepID=A0A2A4Z8X1_9PROT|nr:mechanosensitive ion channel [OCS116 cluster bacterium]
MFEFDASQTIDQVVNWMDLHLFNLNIFIQISAIFFTFLLALLVNKFANPYVNEALSGVADKGKRRRRTVEILNIVLLPIIWVVLQWLMNVVLLQLGYKHDLLRITASLLNAWIVIRVFVSLVPTNIFWRRIVAFIAWTIAALNAANLLKPTVKILEDFGFTVGDARITLYSIISGFLLGVVLFWFALLVSNFLKHRLSDSQHLTPSVQTLLSQLIKVTLIFISLIFTLNIIGLDLSVFTFFSGALGVGLGFGLQKIVSNFVSGIILLVDQSLQPGNVIEVGGTFGKVKTLGARYTTVETRDGHEYLIPNERFITQEVVNWAFSNPKVRRKIEIGVAYDTDVELAMRLIVEATIGVDRILVEPVPVARLVSFGDSSVNIEARFWVDDPANGVANITSDFLLNVWKLFKANGIEIPFPQTDIHIKEIPKIGNSFFKPPV